MSASGLAAGAAAHGVILAESGMRLPADGRPVVEAIDQLLNLGQRHVRLLAAQLDEKLIDAVGVALPFLCGTASRLHLGDKLISHVHVPIFGDLRSRTQVMPRRMLPRLHDSLA